MPHPNEVILVIGATGHQGGAVARALLERQFPVRALTRHPDGPAAKSLAALGAAVTRGDLDDAASLERAMQGVNGVFSVQTPYGPGGVAREEREGKSVIDAAKRVGIAHLVYSSVGGAERRTGIPHFDSKYRIEEVLRASGLHATILRPVFFMENFAGPLGPQTAGDELVLRMALSPHTRLQMIAVRDIGILAALAFENREGIAERATEIAGDELAVTDITASFATATGRRVRYEQQPLAELEKVSAESARMFAWFEAGGYRADISALRRLHPALMTFREWLAQSPGRSVS